MSGIISPTCSAMKRLCSKPSSRKETAAPAGPPIVRSTTLQVRRTPRRGKASRCVPWHFSKFEKLGSDTQKGLRYRNSGLFSLELIAKRNLRSFGDRENSKSLRLFASVLLSRPFPACHTVNFCSHVNPPCWCANLYHPAIRRQPTPVRQAGPMGRFLFDILGS